VCARPHHHRASHRGSDDPQDDLQFTVFLLGIKLVGLLFIVASIAYAIEEVSDSDAFISPLTQWHDAFWYSVVTMATVVRHPCLVQQE
jgi:hypothetical protein